MEEGVFTFIASGDCLAIFPDTTDRVPLRREDSKAPSCVVELNAYRSMASTLLGPTDRSELSTKAIPADPSAPVTTVSVACRCVPTRAGRRWPLRSRYTEPLATQDRKSTRLNSSHVSISYAVFCLKKKKNEKTD